MKAKLKAKCEYTKSILMQFNFYHLTHDMINTIVIVVCVLMAIYSMYSYLTSNEIMKGIFAILFLAIILLTRFLYRLVIKAKFKNSTENSVYNYSFYNEYFTVKEIKDKKYYYKDVAIKCDGDLIYLYVKSNNAYIVNRNDELITFLKEVAKH